MLLSFYKQVIDLFSGNNNLEHSYMLYLRNLHRHMQSRNMTSVIGLLKLNQNVCLNVLLFRVMFAFCLLFRVHLFVLLTLVSRNVCVNVFWSCKIHLRIDTLAFRFAKPQTLSDQMFDGSHDIMNIMSADMLQK